VTAGGPPRHCASSRAARRRAEVVAAAADLFAVAGYHNTTMASIADALGVSKPTVYHYFASKDEILFAIHDEFIELLIARQQRRQATSMPADHELREIMGDILALMDTHRGHVRAFFEHFRDLGPGPSAAIAVKRRRYEAMVREVFVAGAQDGTLRPIDPDLGVLALAGLCNWTYTWYHSDGRLASGDIASQFWDFLMNGVGAVRRR
jgi:TetR/AcrR family transcriptional regulator, cholesterol catabolism regulator